MYPVHVFESVFASYMRKDTSAFQRDAFDLFLQNSVPELLSTHLDVSTSPLSDPTQATYRLHLEHLRVARENDVDVCLQYNLRYSCTVVGDVCLSKNGGEVGRSTGVVLLTLPLLTGSTVLSLPGADYDFRYPRCFVVNGKLRTIPCTLAPLNNEPQLKSTKERSVLEFRSTHRDKLFRSTSTLEFSVAHEGVRCVEVKIPFQKTRLNVGVLALAMGATVNEFLALVRACAGPAYDPFLFEPFELATRTAAALYPDVAAATVAVSQLSGSSTLSTGAHILQNEVFPHVKCEPEEAQRAAKLVTLARVVSLLVQFSADALPEGFRARGDLSSHELTTGANHLGGLLRLALLEHRSYVMKELRKRAAAPPEKLLALLPTKLYNATKLSNRVWYAVATGRWSVRRTGVSHQLNTTNTWAFRAQDRRVSSALNPEGTHYATRAVKSDQYGALCAANSAAGESTGLTSELACTAFATPRVLPLQQAHLTRRVLAALGPESFVPLQDFTAAPFEVAAPAALLFCPAQTPLGVVLNVHVVIATVRALRRTLRVSPFAGVAYEPAFGSLSLLHMEGMFTRPLVVVSPGTEVPTWPVQLHFDVFLRAGLVEYVSKREETTLCRVAVAPDEVVGGSDKFTHVELAQAAFLGIVAASVPFVTGQQAMRAAYWCCQKKQSITCDPSRPNVNAPLTYHQWYSHRPLVRSLVATTLPSTSVACRPPEHQAEPPRMSDAGPHDGVFTPLVVALLALEDNQEDAVLVKRQSVDFGAAAASVRRTFCSEAIPGAESFGFLDDSALRSTARTAHLDLRGLPPRGTVLHPGDVIIAKTQKRQRTGERDLDRSTTVRRESGTVVSSTVSHTPEGSIARVVLETPIPLRQGDKVSSQHSQKGVVARLVDAADLPFSGTSGVVPDLIVSPMGVVSRRTQATLLEILGGKAVSAAGDLALGLDTQQFGKSSREFQRAAEAALVAQGFARDGTEQLYDGRTGLPLRARVFMGVGHTVRLSHLAKTKAHARDTGPINTTTRQATCGRSNGGGLRMGHMELNALVAYGAAGVIKERFQTLADKFTIFVCRLCSTAVDHANAKLQYKFCSACGTGDHVEPLTVSWTFHKLLEELFATGIDARLHLEDESTVLSWGDSVAV